MSQKIIGIDIRYDAVYAVLLNSRDYQIDDYIHIPAPGHQLIENIISISVEAIIKRFNISKTVCIASFPSNNIRYRNITVPFNDRKKIAQILPFELEPLIPINVENCLIDFMIYEETDSYSKLIAAVIEISELKTYLNAFASYNIDPIIVTPGGLSIAKCLLSLNKNINNALFLDIEVNRCNIFVIEFNKIKLIRTIKADLNNLKSFQIDLYRTILIFQELNKVEFEPKDVFITGFGIRDKNFLKEIENFLGVPVKELNLFDELKISLKNKNDSEWLPCKMDNALSLALAKLEKFDLINFRQNSFAPEKIFYKNSKNIFIKLGAFVSFILLIFIIKFYYDNQLLEKKLKNIDNQIIKIFKETCPEVTNIVNPVHQLNIEIDKIKKNKDLNFENPIRFIDILLKISEIIPEIIPVEFTEIKADLDGITLIGTTDNFNFVNEIKINLDKAGIFKKIIISSINIDKSVNKVRFIMDITINKGLRKS